MTGALQIAQRCYTAANEKQLTHILRDISDYFGADNYGVTRYGSTEHGPAANGLTNMSARADAELDRVCPCALDPVMQHLRVSSVPIAWSRQTYCAQGMKSLGDAMCAVGLNSGISLALHLSPTEHFVIGFSWGRDRDVQPSVLADLQLLAVHAWPAFNRAWSHMDLEGPIEPLTDRECLCLYWVGSGMTDDEIATRVGITRRTVERDVQTATAKLNAKRRNQAAVLAERLGYTIPHRLRFGRTAVKRVSP